MPSTDLLKVFWRKSINGKYKCEDVLFCKSALAYLLCPPADILGRKSNCGCQRTLVYLVYVWNGARTLSMWHCTFFYPCEMFSNGTPELFHSFLLFDCCCLWRGELSEYFLFTRMTTLNGLFSGEKHFESRNVAIGPQRCKDTTWSATQGRWKDPSLLDQTMEYRRHVFLVEFNCLLFRGSSLLRRNQMGRIW